MIKDATYQSEYTDWEGTPILSFYKLRNSAFHLGSTRGIIS